MSRWWWLLVLVVGIALATAPATAADDQPPLVDAGLDQTVTNGTTVYLDGGGSTDPDGRLVAFNWSITRPDGTTVAPACPTCERTQFSPPTTGEYAVRLTATDDDGVTRNDTLYVTVEVPPGPSVRVAGPRRLSPGEPTNYTVRMRADGAPLDRLSWYRNGTQRTSVAVSGENATVNLTRTFDNAGRYRLRATARDELGYSGRTTLTVLVGTDGGGGGDFDPCPNGHPIHEPDGHLSHCAQSAIGTNDDLLITVPAANQDTVVYETNDGAWYEMSHQQVEEQTGLDPDQELIPEDAVVQEGNRVNRDTDDNFGDLIIPGRGCVAPCNGGSGDSSNNSAGSSGNSDNSSDGSSDGGSNNDGFDYNGGRNDGCIAPCGAPMR